MLVAVLHDLLRAEVFSSYADMLEAFKCRAARLRIPYDAATIQDAVRQVEHSLGRSLVTDEVARSLVREPAPPPPEITKSEAIRLLGTLGVPPIPTMTALRPLSDDELRRRDQRDDRLKAYRIIQQQILETAQRVAALEAAVEAPDTEAT